jgi:cardiolipin synthase (CMP-forming)
MRPIPIYLPNLITILRILLVPFTIWLMISQKFDLAFLAFVVAAVSDGIDGYLARRFNLHTELGAYLDPLADKALLVSIFVVLGILQFIPAWLVILVATRDVLIIGAVVLAWIMDKPVQMKPLFISKVNTAAQIVFAGSVLAILGMDAKIEGFIVAGVAAVATLTFASGALYMKAWMHHMANGSVPKP